MPDEEIRDNCYNNRLNITFGNIFNERSAQKVQNLPFGSPGADSRGARSEEYSTGIRELNGWRCGGHIDKASAVARVRRAPVYPLDRDSRSGSR